MKKDGADGSLSEMFHVLRAARRRRAIKLLNERSDEVYPVRTLAKEIAAEEHGLPRAQATGEPYRNVYNALSQTHLPSLLEAGIIIYDSERQTVSVGPNLELAALLVDITRPTVTLLFEDPGQHLLSSNE